MYLGASTNVVDKLRHWALLEYLIKQGFKYIEIHNALTPIRTRDLAELLNFSKKGYQFSIHTASKELFESDNLVSQADLIKLKSEIFMAGEMGAPFVNFHIPKRVKINEKVEEQVKDLVSFAKEHNVTLLIENNSSGDFPEMPAYADFLKRTGLKACIDLGHLNIQTKQDFEKQKQILTDLKEYIMQLHVQGNNGLTDQHKALKKKQLPLLKCVLPTTRLIIETQKVSDILKTRKLIEDYFSE